MVEVTMADRVRELSLKMRARRTDTNPYMEDPWDGARHWRCSLTCNGRRMVVYFSQGSAHTEAPSVEDVLNAGVRDAATYENTQDFAEWCADYGYDTDSRKAERTYKAVARITKSLKRVLAPLGETVWENLLHHTEYL